MTRVIGLSTMIYFFRTQDTQAVTLEKIRGASDDLGTRPPVYKALLVHSEKTTGSVVLDGR